MQFVYRSQVSILGPVGYGPTTLPLRYCDAVAPNQVRTGDLTVNSRAL